MKKIVVFTTLKDEFIGQCDLEDMESFLVMLKCEGWEMKEIKTRIQKVF